MSGEQEKPGERRERKKSTFMNPMGDSSNEGTQSLAVAAMVGGKEPAAAAPAEPSAPPVAEDPAPTAPPVSDKAEPEPKKEVKVKGQKAKTDEPLDVRTLVTPVKWPLGGLPQPVLYEGRADVDKPFNMRMKEPLSISIKKHCEALGVDVSVWSRTAMLKMMQEEQQYFMEQEMSKRS